MKNRLSIIFTILTMLISISTFACDSDRPIFKDELLIFKFHPSFHYSSEFVVDRWNQNLRIEIFKPENFFGKNDKEVITRGTFDLQPRVVNDLFTLIENLKFDPNRIDDRIIADGISGSCELLVGKRVEKKLNIRSPNREDFKIDYQVIDAFFMFVEEYSEKKNFFNDYIENLKGYFDYGLPVSLMNENPLEYRFWGAITSGEVEELYSLMDSLPNNKPIIFDFRNFSGMGNMFHVDFEELNDTHSIYYLIDESNFNTDLKEIGNCQFFFERKTLMSKLRKRH